MFISLIINILCFSFCKNNIFFARIADERLYYGYLVNFLNQLLLNCVVFLLVVLLDTILLFCCSFKIIILIVNIGFFHIV